MCGTAVCGVFAGFGAVLLFLRSDPENRFVFKTSGVLVMVAGTWFAVVSGMEMLRLGMTVSRPVIEFLAGFAVMPVAALIGTMRYRHRMRRERKEH